MNAPSSQDPSNAFEIAALRLHLVVGMAASDDEIHDAEVTGLAELVATCEVPDTQRRYLEQLLIALIAHPPQIDELLRALVDRIDRPDLAQLLVEDLVVVAQLDDRIDPREEALLRLVCGALELDPVSLYEPHERARGDASASDLAALVRGLLNLDLDIAA